MKTFSQAPYYDDFKESNQFYRILFRPGYAVQARELTQLQTILHNQIKRQGDHIFQDGSMVIPGQMSIDTTVGYVKIAAVSSNVTDLTVFEGKTVTGESGLTAQVLKVIAAAGTDPITMYVRYTNSGDNAETKVFASDEVLTVDPYTATVESANPTGIGSIATVERGVYYVSGSFVLVEPQTIVLDKYSDTPTYRIGLTVDEQIITPVQDTSLLDNAQGSYNYAAPGAHRYYIDLKLSTKSIDTTDDANFIELLRVENGVIKRHVTKTKYSELEKTMARRTYDESGNYTVRPFTLDIREHRNNNRGQWMPNTAYIIGDVVTNNGHVYVAKNDETSQGSTGPTHTAYTAYDGGSQQGVQWEYTTLPHYNRGIYKPEDGGDQSKFAAGLEPGKAYVEGYEIEKISTEYVDINKSRESIQVSNAIVPATVGNFVLVTNINSAPPVDTFQFIDLYNRVTTTRGVQPGGVKVGTARARFIEWDSGIVGQQTSIYKLGLFDVQMLPGYEFNRDVKSFFYAGASQYRSFSADIQPVTTRLIGSATAANTTTITGNGTSFQTDIRVGDYVSFSGTLRRVTAVGSQNEITVDSAITITGTTIDLVTTEIHEPDNLSLVFPLPYYAIKSVRDALNANKTSYSVYRRLSGTAGSDLGTYCELQISTDLGTLASAADNDNYTIIDNTDGVGGGTVVSVTSDNITVMGSSATIRLPDTYAGKPFIVIAAINRGGSSFTEKIKTLVLAGPSNPETIIHKTTAATATLKEILLGKADCYRLVSVKMKSGTFASPGDSYDIDITDRYDFDNGQRTTHYDIGRIILKASYTPPTAPIEIVFEYFTHSPGDYFTVNSYGDYSTDTSNTSNVPYYGIPFFNGKMLSDCIDFRPSIGYNSSTNVIDFDEPGAMLSNVAKRGVDVRTDYVYYLARKTKIAVDFNGNFFTIDGVSSLYPGDPSDPAMGMVLYNLTLEPYTFSTSTPSVSVNTYDNKRYTMRDIGRLEKRIDNLEYYTSLSLLEQQTESLDVIDSYGDTRFKNGFIVDNFAGHNTGDTTSPDYMCAIDMEAGELRPYASQQNINMVEVASSAAARATRKYQMHSDVITLPITEHVPIVTQAYASRLENINPFAVFTFLGNVQLTPTSDDWFEVDRRPDLVVDVEGNYTTIKTLAEKAGVLGTIWNAWQTVWTGAPIAAGQQIFQGRYSSAWVAYQGIQLTPADMNARFGFKQGAGWAARNITVGTTAWQVGQKRTGTTTSLVTKIDRRVVADRVLSTAAIPYIRSRNILIQVKNMKPNTRFYPYFDDVAIDRYCTPASRMVYTLNSGTFDSTTNVGGLSTDVERRINGDTQVCLNRGDMIRGSSSQATAIVVGSEYNPDTGQRALYVVNVKGTFTTADTITGNVSGATGKFVSLTSAVQGGNIVSNFNGEVSLLFNIPNTDAVRFRCGTREFKLVDSATADGAFTSRGRANYNAAGVLEVRQQTVNSIRNAELVQTEVVEAQVIVQTADRVISDSGWYDPLAQTFLVQQPGGAFLTKIDIFFASKDPKIPVTLEIRECINGYPGKKILPFSKVSLKPEDVNLSSSRVTLDGVSVPKYDTPTTFTFPSPVYVQDNAEYAIVLSSDSNNYKVWISQMGDQIPGSTRTISEQPYLGTLFKSQNASTWTADQTQDLKFTIYRARFDVQANSNVEFVNDVIPYQPLDTNPVETREGQNIIRIWQRDHGMPAGSKVKIVGMKDGDEYGTSTSGQTITTSINATNVTAVGTTFTTDRRISSGTVLYTTTNQFIGVVANVVSDVQLTLVNNAAIALSGAAFKAIPSFNGIPATEIFKQHNAIANVDINSYTLTTTTSAVQTGYAGGDLMRATHNIQFDVLQPSIQIQTFPETTTTCKFKAISGKSVDAGGTQVAYIQSAEMAEVLANDNNQLTSPCMIASEINETAKSATLSIAMKTTNDSVSPVIDTQRVSLIAVSNKVNNPSFDNMNVGGLDDTIVLDGAPTELITFTNNVISSDNLAVWEMFKTAKVGKYLTIAGSTSGTSVRLITAVPEDGSSITLDSAPEAVVGDITLTQHEMFVSEIAPANSSTFSKYVTRKVALANASTFLRIRFAASIPAEAGVDVYYRVTPVGSTTPIENIDYTYVAPDVAIPYVQNGSTEFIDATLSTGDLDAFDNCQIKIVMRSTNTSAIPRIKDLRVIACV